jgi:hypothetical protein
MKEKPGWKFFGNAALNVVRVRLPAPEILNFSFPGEVLG